MTLERDIIADFEPISRRVKLSKNLSLYDSLTEIGIRIRSLCGGKGTCGKCKLHVYEGASLLSPLTHSEKAFLPISEIEDGWRLACQAFPDYEREDLQLPQKEPHLRMYIPDDLLLEDFKILTAGTQKNINNAPAIRKYFLSVNEPTLQSPLSDYERVLQSFQQKYPEFQNAQIDMEFSLFRKLGSILRKNSHQITLTIWDNRTIIDCEPGDTTKECYGIAFDIGTTTLVGYLINLTNGRVYATSSKLNPQTAYGEDVITRMVYTRDHADGLEKLHHSVINALNQIIQDTCERSGVSIHQIYEATIVGNSVMHHIFLGISPETIGLSPYVPIVQRGLNTKALTLGLNLCPTANIYTLPLIAGFVGADTMGVILASQIEKEEKLTVAIDIGTNGEIVLGNSNFLAAASCAAGSALEGAHIKDGMRAASGAIDTIKINHVSFASEYTTIQNKPPIGICGSGLIDLVAELIRAKILRRNGNFNKEILPHERFIQDGKKVKYIVVPGEDTKNGDAITISQEDIRQIQMAKAAFYSAIRLLLKSRKEPVEIEQVFLAGAFGNYIDKENARFIGMIPDIPTENIFQIGNAAGIGAQDCLIDNGLREKAMSLLKKGIDYVEIAVKKDFQKEYAEAMYFPHFRLDYFPSLEIYKEIPAR